jgi:hypothetical protein
MLSMQVFNNEAGLVKLKKSRSHGGGGPSQSGAATFSGVLRSGRGQRRERNVGPVFHCTRA